jgi:serine/threonine-protein kinase SRPK3
MRWLIDLMYRDHQYVALKIYIHNSAQHRELPFYEHLNKILPSTHPGVSNVRKLQDSFEVVGPHGKHIALVLQVSQMSLRDMDTCS